MEKKAYVKPQVILHEQISFETTAISGCSEICIIDGRTVCIQGDEWKYLD